MTRAAKASGNSELKRATATVQAASSRIQSSSDPSWAPQTAETL